MYSSLSQRCQDLPPPAAARALSGSDPPFVKKEEDGQVGPPLSPLSPPSLSPLLRWTLAFGEEATVVAPGVAPAREEQTIFCFQATQTHPGSPTTAGRSPLWPLSRRRRHRCCCCCFCCFCCCCCCCCCPPSCCFCICCFCCCCKWPSSKVILSLRPLRRLPLLRPRRRRPALSPPPSSLSPASLASPWFSSLALPSPPPPLLWPGERSPRRRNCGLRESTYRRSEERVDGRGAGGKSATLKNSPCTRSVALGVMLKRFFLEKKRLLDSGERCHREEGKGGRGRLAVPHAAEPIGCTPGCLD